MPQANNTSTSKRIASNSLLLFARMFAITIINLYAVRLLLNSLGQEDYGTFNAVAGVVMTSTFITSTLAICIQRFYSYAMGKGEEQSLNDIFSASMNIIFTISLLMLVVLESIGLWFINESLPIPQDRVVAANWVFQSSIGVILMGLLQLPYTGAIFAHEDMGYFALISLAECLFRLFIVLLINVVPVDGLVFYGIGLFVVAVIIFLFYASISRHRYIECRYHRKVEKNIYKSLLSFSGWTMYSAIAGVGITQGITLLFYSFFGPLATAAYAISLQVLHAFQALSNSIVVAFRPSMVKSYAEGDYTFLNKMFNANNKLILFLLAVVAIPLAVELRIILKWWLGSYTEYTVMFTRLIIMYMVLLSLHNPVTTIVQSTGRVKYYCLIVETVLLTCLPISWLLFKFGATAELSLVILILTSMSAHIVRLIILKHLYPVFSYWQYWRRFLQPGISILVLSSIIIYLAHTFIEADLPRVAVSFILSLLSVLSLAWLIGMSAEERRIILQKLNIHIIFSKYRKKI